MIHCKTCRVDKEQSEFVQNNKNYKTCNPCRVKKRSHSTKRLTIEDCKEFAISKSGECLSTEYVNMKTKLKWKCRGGHEWVATFDSVKRGTWCPTCAGLMKYTIEECKEFAISKGGECLSNEYINNQTKMKWKCSEGHEWDVMFGHIKHGSWCPECARVSKKLGIEECKEYAISKGGECLSTVYVNTRTKMKWRCAEGHEWNATFSHIKSGGQWCPKCATNNMSENLCRDIFEKYLLEKFPNVRPKFLDGLELDGYNEELNIAFEYNGIQHYEYIPYFHRNGPEAFEKQKDRDLKKYKICRDRNIKLIIIPYQYDYRNPQLLEDYIYDELNKIC